MTDPSGGPPWQARALSLAQAVAEDTAVVAAALPAGDVLTSAQAAAACSATLVAMLQAHQAYLP